MKQYYYFHNSRRRYEPICSERDGVKNSEYIKLMRSLSAFTRKGATCFTYLPYDGKAYLLQTNEEDESFAHGLIGEIVEIPSSPAGYIGQLEREYKEKGEEVIPDRDLPSARAATLITAGSYQPYWADIVELLLFTDKRVYIVGGTPGSLENYLRILFELLPLPIAKNIGFTVAPANRTEFLADPTHPIAKGIRIVAMTDDISGVEANAVVVNLSREYQSLVSSYHGYSSVIKSYGTDLSNPALRSFIAEAAAYIDSAGKFEPRGLDALIASTREYSISTLSSILSGKSVKDEHKEGLAHFLNGGIDNVKECVMECLGPDIIKDEKTFSALCDLYAETSSRGVLAFISFFADYRETTYGMDDGLPELMVNEGLFQALDGREDNCGKSLIAAVLSACFSVVGGEFAPRLQAFYRFADKKRDGISRGKRRTEREVIYLLELERTLFEHLTYLLGGKPTIELLPNDLIKELTAPEALSFGECLAIALSQPDGFIGESVLCQAIVDRLKNINEVQRNVRLATNLQDFEEFLKKYSVRVVAIDNFIASITTRDAVIDDFKNFRSDYILRTFDYLSQTEQKKILRNVQDSCGATDVKGLRAMFAAEDTSPEIKTDIANAIRGRARNMCNKRCVKEKLGDKFIVGKPADNGKFFRTAFLISFLYAIITVALIAAPQVALSFVLGVDVFGRVLLNVQYYAVVFPLYAGLLHYLAFLNRWKRTKHYGQDSLMYATKITLLFAILPLAIYELANLTYYFFF